MFKSLQEFFHLELVQSAIFYSVLLFLLAGDWESDKKIIGLLGVTVYFLREIVTEISRQKE